MKGASPYLNIKQSIRILIVDDHPMTIMGYELFLEDATTEYNFETDSAHNCDQVLSIIENQRNDFFDIILLDINLPSSRDNILINGEDLGIYLKSNFPNIKIIVHTGLNDQLRITSILKTIKPEGFLIKSDIEPQVFLEAINAVIKNETYYSEKINRLLEPFHINEVHVDSLDRKILYYLSIGEKMKNLPLYLPMSMATIERRKKNLKIIFGLEDESDRKLLTVAREKGFL